jgi:hypothetical protein
VGNHMRRVVRTVDEVRQAELNHHVKEEAQVHNRLEHCGVVCCIPPSGFPRDPIEIPNEF